MLKAISFLGFDKGEAICAVGFCDAARQVQRETYTMLKASCHIVQ
jgi:hypothetical protein